MGWVTAPDHGKKWARHMMESNGNRVARNDGEKGKRYAEAHEQA